MLVLSRKEGDSIVIQDNIIVKVLSVKGERVRIGIEADKSIPIHRGELDPLEPRPSGGEAVN